MFEGKAVKLNQLDNGVVELVFDYVEESVNKFDRTALEEWRTSVDFITGNAFHQWSVGAISQRSIHCWR